MPVKAPSKQALRLLAHLCHVEQPFAMSYATSSFAAKSKRTAFRQHASVRTATTLRDAPEPSTFANDPSRYDPQDPKTREPKHQGTIDPQSESSQILPDISNYYTLFPQTLPNGPPRPSSQLSSATSADPQTSGQNEDQNPPFHLNPRTLRTEFLRLQSQHHPDKYPSNTPAHQKAYALSTLLNNAYKTLADPLLRAQYLLHLNYGIDVTSEDNSEHPTDQGTLMEVMEAQECIEEATDQQQIDELKEQNRERIKVTEGKMGQAFEMDDVEAAKKECVRLKYWMSLQQGLDDWEPGKEVRLIH